MFKVLLFCFAVWAVTLGERKSSQLYASSYILYTKDNHKSGQKIEATAASIIPLSINMGTNCAIIVHGFSGRGSDAMSMVLRDAFITSGKTNVIVVDWTMAARDNNYATEAVPAIGENVAELIKLLSLYSKISRAKLHLVGFDLGAHVVGCAGRAYNDIARITGLNPVGGEEWSLSGNHLKPTDALYVEVIHTEVSKVGIAVALGDVDFFPNGGVIQPGCPNIACSHNRAWELFAASLTHGDIIGNRCKSLNEALKPHGTCTGFALPMGNNELIKYGSGVFRLDTIGVYPYRCKIKCGMVDSIIAAIESMTSVGNGPDPMPGANNFVP